MSFRFFCRNIPALLSYGERYFTPHTALTEEQGSFFVYLQVDEEGYKKQLVTLGADNGEKVQILSGVKAGDKVVTQGAISETCRRYQRNSGAQPRTLIR